MKAKDHAEQASRLLESAQAAFNVTPTHIGALHDRKVALAQAHSLTALALVEARREA